MIFKFVINNEIHRVRSELTSFKELLELINRRFEGKFKESFIVKYVDSDGDHVSVTQQEDFGILLEEFKGSKTVKLLIDPAPYDNNKNPEVLNL